MLNPVRLGALKNPLRLNEHQTLPNLTKSDIGHEDQGGITMKISALFASVLITASSPLLATDIPSPLPIAQILECKIDAQDWSETYSNLKDGRNTKALKWEKQPSTNPDLTEYLLPEPISFMGEATRSIALSENGFYLILNISDPAPFSRKLGIDPEKSPLAGYNILVENPDGKGQQTSEYGGSFLGEHEVYFRNVVPNSVPYFSRAVHKVFNRNSHPGKTFAGCDYYYDIDTEAMGNMEAATVSEENSEAARVP